MQDLVNYLNEFAALYEGDAFGLASDFELVAGISMNELCDKLSDEIDSLKETLDDD